MNQQLFLGACAVAGFAVIWRNWIAQHSKHEAAIKASLGGFSNVLLCGSCFTYWLALAYTVAFHPILPWALQLVSGTGVFAFLVRNFLSWMVLAYVSVLFRFGYVYVQESVSMLVHRHDAAHGGR